MKTQVILTSNIIGLGAESDRVKVAAGYARNFLFPQRLAIPLTRANKRQIEALQKRRAEREAHEFNTMTELAKGLSKLICVVKVKAGEDGKMFGSVTAGMIADELKHQFDITLDKRKIRLEHAIRALGEQEIELNLHADVKSTLKVRVESLTPVAAPVPAAAAPAASAEAKAGEGKRPRTEKRGFARREARAEGAAKPEEAKPRGEMHAKVGKPEKSERPPKAPRPPKAEKKEDAKPEQKAEA
ncbi:MAG: 50S ribosomal protein L9 [Verrucomicrobiota bacterium]|jgi:large subunit ribosomal protein L9